jgi:4-hydroxy-2-oxoheptanedioate aldolase
VADDEVVPIAMIETRGAYEHLDAILRVDGLGAVFVGPADLSQALGGPPGVDFEEGPAVSAIARVVERSTAAGVPAGIYNRSPAYARRMAALGYRFVAMGSALDLVVDGAAAALAAARGD